VGWAGAMLDAQMKALMLVPESEKLLRKVQLSVERATSTGYSLEEVKNLVAHIQRRPPVDTLKSGSDYVVETLYL